MEGSIGGSPAVDAFLEWVIAASHDPGEQRLRLTVGDPSGSIAIACCDANRLNLSVPRRLLETAIAAVPDDERSYLDAYGPRIQSTLSRAH